MSLFQSVVVNRYVKELDAQLLSKAWQSYADCFLDPIKQDNIRLSKEEQYQEGFLRDLFVDVFDYTLNPNPNYDLTTEFKNQTSSKKADGAILKDGDAIGVIELKGMNITDMGKIEAQAFGYKNNQPKCRYVITSNFQKLRLYIDNAVEYEEFDLFAMTQDRFALLYLLLRQTSMIADLPAKIKSESISQEEAITKQLYKDYSVFKRELFADLTANNADIDALLLFQKSQKLLDRLLFIFFAEDSHLLPANFAKGMINEWQQLKALKMTVPLYDRVKAYFGYLDQGHKDEHSEIFAYNGGLFRPDTLLDSMVISDELLRTHILILSEYDFASEVDVNILGHIFENSLSELDEVKAQLAGEVVDKSQTKRKKDGVFYTPKYITKYIVENTIGKLCADKKSELAIIDEDFIKPKKLTGKAKETLQSQDSALESYRNWLLQITVCDPACGSGAFLNEALNFLIAEHSYIDELHAKLYGDSMIFPDIENSILENNLFGVDINEESVEIAKLSLWLRTAQPRRKLNNLNDNIQCGNSLIDDIEVAGDKAFNWQTAFPQVFAKGGFDVVIGNPPYGIFVSEKEELHYKENFPLTEYKINLYILFIERMFQVFSKGLINFIIPKSLLSNTYYGSIRKQLLTNSKIHEIFMISEKVFPDAEVGGSLILKYEIVQSPSISNKLKLISADKYYDYEQQTALVNEIEQQFFLGIPHYEISPIATGADTIVVKLNSLKKIRSFYTLKNGLNPGNIKNILIRDTKDSINHKPIIWGKELNRNSITWGGQFINYDYNIADTISLEDIQSKKGMNKQSKIDFALRTPDMFEKNKVIVRKTGDRFIAAKDEEGFYFDTLIHGIYENDSKYSLDYVLTILNSSSATKLYRLLHDIKGKVFAKISLDKLGAFPLPNIADEEMQELSELGVLLQKTQPSMNLKVLKFSKYLTGKLNLEKTSRKLENWYELSFADFITELTKALIANNKIRAKEGQSPIAELTKTDEFEWMELFESKKQEVVQLQQQIEQTEQQIDQMVYKLYDLTDDEIAIIEAS